MAFTLLVNGIQYAVDVEPETPLLWVLRDSIGPTGTKYGCTVLIKGQAVRSCVTQASRATGTPITTIEGLSTDGTHPVQLAWKEFDVPQCGYCQSGQILAAVALLDKSTKPTDDDIDAQMTNACRCGTYHRIRQAIHRAAALRSS
jgi:isoquinoline 1-oxidoreductase alpha subunit